MRTETYAEMRFANNRFQKIKTDATHLVWKIVRYEPDESVDAEKGEVLQKGEHEITLPAKNGLSAAFQAVQEHMQAAGDEPTGETMVGTFHQTDGDETQMIWVMKSGNGYGLALVKAYIDRRH